MVLAPDPIIAGALACALMLPLFLLLFTCGRAPIAGPGARFKAASLASIGAYFVWCLASMQGTSAGNILAGSFIVAGSILFWFVPWSLLTWGFTLHMLTVLGRSSMPLTLDQWISAYVGGGGAEVFAHDRLQVLFRLGMIRRIDGAIVPTPAGRGMARAARMAKTLMGLR